MKLTLVQFEQKLGYENGSGGQAWTSYPDVVVCDNGPQFSSMEFIEFLKDRAIRLVGSSVCYPQANGLVERFNWVFKNFVQVTMLEQRPLRQAQPNDYALTAQPEASPATPTLRAPAPVVSDDRVLQRRVQRPRNRRPPDRYRGHMLLVRYVQMGAVPENLSAA
nr:uncharacterized protein LOC129385812 [Dermacentor andersoni]